MGEFELGDINQDGNADVLDVVSMVNHVLGSSLLDETQIIIGDVNQDGSVDVLDIILLVNQILESAQ